jgi:hypothetical protein
MIDWKCQLKLSIMIGIIAAMGTHIAMDRMIQIRFDWWFDLAIFISAALAFMAGLRLNFIKCSVCQPARCEKCPINQIK